MAGETARLWFKQAVHDLEMAEKNLEIGGYDVAAFLSQQAVEKLFKALFALRGEKIPRIHYIDELSQKLNLPENIIAASGNLAADYALARYPDVSSTVPYEQYTEEIAKEKVATAQHIFKSLESEYVILIEDETND